MHKNIIALLMLIFSLTAPCALYSMKRKDLPEENNKIPLKKIAPYYYVCICSYGSNSKHVFENHWQYRCTSNLNREILTCNLCGQSNFSIPATLQTHINSCKEKHETQTQIKSIIQINFRCDCGKEYASKGNRDNHWQYRCTKNLNREILTCNLCGKSNFSSPYSLQRHIDNNICKKNSEDIQPKRQEKDQDTIDSNYNFDNLNNTIEQPELYEELDSDFFNFLEEFPF